MPHVGEQIFESIDTPGLINCMEVSETWRELAGNVLIKRWNGKIYMQIFEAFKRGKTKSAYMFLWSLNTDELFQCTLVSKTWKDLAENVLIKRWKGSMFEACEIGAAKIVQLLLERCNSEEIGLNIKYERGYTPFMKACYYGHKDVVQLLLEHSERIELNAKNEFGWTAFMFACENGHKDVVQLLLDHSERIDLNARNFCNWSPKPLSSFFGKTALTIAHQRGHQDIVQMVKPKSSFCSQFSFFYPDMFEFLLIFGFSIVFATALYFAIVTLTALTIAVMYQSVAEPVKLLFIFDIAIDLTGIALIIAAAMIVIYETFFG